MTQAELDVAVAIATGETCHTVNQLGFSLADPIEPHFDPEPYDVDKFLDWDEVQLCRLERVVVC